MVYKWAVADGNWSSTSTWNDGTLPGVDDTVWANGYTVTIDQDVDVYYLSNHGSIPSGGPGLTNGGVFQIDSNVDRTITCDYLYAYNSTTCLYITDVNTTNTITLNVGTTDGNLQAYPIKSYSSGTINYTGDIRAVRYTTAGFISYSGGLTFNMVGNLRTDSDSRADVLNFQSTINNTEKLTINITGEINPGAVGVADGINIATTCETEFNFNGVINGNGSPALSVNVGNSFTGLIEGSFGVQNINSIITVSATAGTSEIRFKDMDISGSSSSRPINVVDETPLVFENCNLCFADGYAPWVYDSSNRIYFENDTAVTWCVDDKLGNTTYMYSQFLGQPSESDVRDGTVYGQSDEFEGTCAIPPAESVVKNVPVDDTVGEWAFTEEVVDRMEKCSTVEITGGQMAGYNI